MGFWKEVKKDWTNPKKLICGALILDAGIIGFGYKNMFVLILSVILFAYLVLAYYWINKKEN